MSFKLNGLERNYETGALGSIVALGAATYCSIVGHELALDLVDATSLSVEYINTIIRGGGMFLGGLGGAVVGTVVGSFLPGGRIYER